MNCNLEIIFASTIVILFILGFVVSYIDENKRFNKGICPKCGTAMVPFDTDSSEYTGYACPNCEYNIHTVWINPRNKFKIYRKVYKNEQNIFGEPITEAEFYHIYKTKWIFFFPVKLFVSLRKQHIDGKLYGYYASFTRYCGDASIFKSREEAQEMIDMINNEPNKFILRDE